MKTLGLIVVLGIGVIAMLLAVVPVGTTVSISIYPDHNQIVIGLLRIGEIRVQNDGVFTRVVKIPELVACTGDTEIALDAFIETGGGIVRGLGQLESITVRPGETGVVFLIARDIDKNDKVFVYHRTANFSCLTATNALN